MRNRGTTALAVAAAALTAAALWVTQGAVTPRTATWDDVLVEAREGGYRLITTDDLWKRYNDDRNRLLLVDTRQEWEYRTGHLRGAVNFPMEPTWLARWQNRWALARFLGADKDRLIIFY